MIYAFILSITSFLSILGTRLYAEEGAPTSRSFVSPALQPAVMIGIALVFFYFILWRPEQKRRKALQAKRNSIEKGDKITAMGIVGTVDEVRENTVILSIASGKIEILKAAITDTFKSEETPKDPK